MSYIMKVFGIGLIGLFIFPVMVLAECTDAKKEYLKKDGWDDNKIESFCNVKEKLYGRKCVTNYGFCILNNIDLTLVGTQCYCVNKFNGKSDEGKIEQ